MGSSKDLQNAILKPLGAHTQLVIGALVTANSSVFDLRAATQTFGKFSTAIFGYVGSKTGTAGVGGLTLTVTTGTTSTPTTGMTHFPVTVVGTDAMHGYAPNSTTVVMVTKFIDLSDSQVREFLRCTIDATGTASDTWDGHFFVILGGARELPMTNVAALTTA